MSIREAYSELNPTSMIELLAKNVNGFQRSVVRTLPCETSKMKIFPTIVNGFQPLTIFGKSSILDVSQGSDYASLKQNFRMKPQTNLEKVCNKRHVTRKDQTVAKF